MVKSAVAVAQVVKMSKQDRLIKIANKRVPKAVKAISLLGNLGAYGPTQEQVEKIQSVLEEAVSTAIGRLHETKKSNSAAFFSL